jgi:hypothetical protein
MRNQIPKIRFHALLWMFPHLVSRTGSVLIIILIGVGFFAAQQTNIGQTLTVQARTLGLEIEFSGKRQVWRLSGATLCRHRPPIEELTGEQLQQPFTLCSADNAFPDVTIPEGTMSLGAGAQLRVDMAEKGGLRLRLLKATEPINLAGGNIWQPKDELLLTATQWSEAGTLRFDGEIVIGHQIEDGTRNFLLEGRYVVRERLMLHRILEAWRNPDPVTVTEDQLFLGDSIRIKRAGRDLFNSDGLQAQSEEFVSGSEEIGMARGFLTSTLDQSLPGFEVVASSTPDKSEVTIVRFQNRATKVEPRWLDRVQNDPMLIALTIIVTLIGSFAVLKQKRD